ncbi:ABC transporter substrate-binding protein [Mycolicibacterium diernhoferi]|uniref:Peptide ABC transporter n=1 Tax=Mycolicibacterium diernhoferi TaxID=1801 RepID=A0A1Q4HHU0_9MYCO|nr:ABC transporter substrate-binding protein [Mycolicibacterium diernhoferi]OJZ67067.1 peptide ABC transporter [Mycolicibacterium diernhoferi]OPE56324.1 peptide ABC transporter [Mycolicibacterium diernhoferi]PEG53711.1 peptide ABC transporter [Mycolicibacterium diernhoferi]QYL23263.1 ABC transporter substrate-binding protein [Mycolicibacterium diernhoferi]
MSPLPPVRRHAALGSTALAVALVLSGCGGGSGNEASSEDAGTPVSGGSIVYATDREPTCLDPHNFGDMPQTYIARQYLDSLVSERPDGSVVPWLADSWEVSPDGLTYIFKIKQGVKFHDGTPLDAEAVHANFVQILDPATESATDAGYLRPYYESSRAIDPATFELKLKTPYSALLPVLSQAFFGIESPKAMARGLEQNCQSPVGTGPFIVKAWHRGQSVELERNPDYNSAPADAKHQGPAYLDSVTWKFIEDGSVRAAAVQGRDADIIFNPPPQQVAALKADPNLTTQEFTHTGLPNGIALNTSRAPFDDTLVRQAFIHGANAEAAVKSAYLGVYEWEHGPISSTTPYFKDLRSFYSYDRDKADKLLDEAGWTQRDADGFRTKDGKRLTAELVYSADTGDTPPADVTLFQNIQSAEKEIGFDVVLKPLPQDQYFAAFSDKDAYDGLTGAYWNSPTPAVLSIVFSSDSLKAAPGNNMSWVENPKIDELVRAAAGTTDTAEQQRLYGQTQEIVAEEAYQLGLYPVLTRLVAKKNLRDVWIEPSEGEPVLHDAWLAP